jgi:hypothetical protein
VNLNLKKRPSWLFWEVADEVAGEEVVGDGSIPLTTTDGAFAGWDGAPDSFKGP